MKTGKYEPLIQKKGEEESFIKDIKDNEVFWRIKTGKDSWFDTKSQVEAEIISRLVKIEKLIKMNNYIGFKT